LDGAKLIYAELSEDKFLFPKMFTHADAEFQQQLEVDKNMGVGSYADLEIIIYMTIL
jgi:hypothetical protein